MGTTRLGHRHHRSHAGTVCALATACKGITQALTVCLESALENPTQEPAPNPTKGVA